MTSFLTIAQNLAPKCGVHTTASLLNRFLIRSGSVLELGCGRDSTVLGCRPDIDYVGVDAFKPYLDAIATKYESTHRRREFILGLFDELVFPRHSFDQIVLIDVLEHLNKSDGSVLLEKASYWGRGSVLLKTTNGYVPQGQMDGNVHQRHLSGWEIAELESRGYAVYGLSGMKRLRRNLSLDTWSDDLSLSMRYRPRKMWLGLAGLSQIYTLRFPQKAFELFAVKNLDST